MDSDRNEYFSSLNEYGAMFQHRLLFHHFISNKPTHKHIHCIYTNPLSHSCKMDTNCCCSKIGLWLYCNDFINKTFDVDIVFFSLLLLLLLTKLSFIFPDSVA